MSWASSAPGVTGWEYRPQYGPVSNAAVHCVGAQPTAYCVLSAARAPESIPLIP